LDLEPCLAIMGVQRNAGGIGANPRWLDARKSGVKFLGEGMMRDRGA
jgi:hypothetical protein